MKKAWLFIALSTCLFACRETFLGSDPPSSPRENFEYLWKTLDQKYSFFAYKEVDWDKVYQKYSPRIKDPMKDVDLFNVLFDMLSELKDSHVNLTSPFNVTRYEQQFAHSPVNFDELIITNYYLKKDYYQTGPLKHQFLSNGNVGYIRYESFEDDIAESFDFVINRFKDTKGIILDMRNNGGGNIGNVFALGTHLADKTRLVYISYMKNGPGHEDFSAPNYVSISPSDNVYKQKVCILTNRRSYSATSFFVLAMRNFPNVTVVGDTTGGGLGAPTGCELPNGWGCRFSGSRTLTMDGKNYENGIPPDVTVNMSHADALWGKDSIIEEAIRIINSQ